MRRSLAMLSAVILIGLAGGAGHAAADDGFGRWLEQLRGEAQRRGISPAVLDEALSGITPDPQVVALDRKQPEKTLSFTDYLNNTVNDHRVAQGREMLAQYGDLLREIGDYYGVPPRYIVALWGIETSYGNNMGNFSVVQSLATLAYEGRRASLFRKELLDALTILDREQIPPADLTGSWAGAMGHCQFMPGTYLHYAVDWDHDGRRDIWNSLPDAFASIANYLNHLGWRRDLSWGQMVGVPADFPAREADLKISRSIGAWSRRGVTFIDGSPLPDEREQASVIFPGTPAEGAYLVSDNYKLLLQWNRSRYFATAVGTLADRISSGE
jgi:membrane-bound lytic murein transglycosylase B